MTFKEQLAADVAAAFFNNDEFSEKHTLNGVEMDITIDVNELQRRNAGKVFSAETSGLYKGNLLIFVSASQYGAKPAIGSVINLDGKPKRVAECIDEAGVYSIELEGLRS